MLSVRTITSESERYRNNPDNIFMPKEAYRISLLSFSSLFLVICNEKNWKLYIKCNSGNFHHYHSRRNEIRK